jgi:hypothetical protein
MLGLKGASMKTTDLFLRCYAEQHDGLWVAVCIDLCLAAQASDKMDAINKLNLQIVDYVKEAFSEPEHTEQLLTQRKAPLSQIMRFYWLKLKYHLANSSNTAREVSFTKAMPVTPATC